MTDNRLHGLRVAVTRPDHGADELAARLSDVGAVVVRLPLVAVVEARDPQPLTHALEHIADYDWIVFTSASAARFVARAAALLGAPLPTPRARIAAVGAATSAAVTRELGWRVDVVPDEAAGVAVTPALQAVDDLRGRRVLWPRARDAHAALRLDLAAAGAVLDDPEAYRTVTLPESAAALAEQLARGELAAITLTSPSAVAALAETRPAIDRCVVAVIGPTTAAAARAAGLPVHVEPEEHTIPALVEELARFFARSRESR